MNFDELQKQWNNQSTEDVQINKESLHKTKSIVEKVNKNIRNELIFCLFSIVFLVAIPIIDQKYINGYLAFFYYFILFQIFICSLTYYKKFYLFKKSTQNQDALQSKENIIKMYYDLRFAVESYRSACYFLIPQIMVLYFILFSNDKTETYFNQIINFKETFENNPNLIFKIFGIGIFLLVLVIIFSEWMINQYYGKYLKQIKNILDQFNS